MLEHRTAVPRVLGWLFAGRFHAAGLVLLVFLAISGATRIGLALFNGDAASFAPPRLVGWLLLGTLFDLGVGAYLLLPFAMLGWALPGGRWGARLATVLLPAVALVLIAGMVLTAAAEFVFWNEFGVRFNFIAVDYLIYTNEVLGNIRESYPLPVLLGAVAAVTLLLFLPIVRPLLRAARSPGMSLAGRSARSAVLLAWAPLSFCAVDASYKDFIPHAPSAQLSGNGVYEFLHAFRLNEIDYAEFYRQLPPASSRVELRGEFVEAGSTARFVPGAAMPIERDVVGNGPEKRLNVVLISVESLSADFLGTFGNGQGLTPRLDALARHSLVFTRLYATGTRTVRGLEAISMSLPPTPGHAVVKRPHNDHLFTLGEVFASKGYEPIYLYGGYSYFDNMREFFAGNGYTVTDRTSLARHEIHAANVWGVADEDLFTLSLRELDRRAAAGRRFFAHIMTTSNHRPFTYPEGRIDIASHSGRHGAVKYTDWAIGDFIDRARDRPWFANTMFVIVADHGASSRGTTELPIDTFHIPLLVYAPAHVPPGRVDYVASQIDVGPTVLALLNFSYRSRFFGQDILTEGARHQRALLANYQTIGYLQDGVLVELRPKGRYRVIDAASGRPRAEDGRTRHLLDEAIAYYQTASEMLKHGGLRLAARPPEAPARLLR